jgi:uncharacterized protein YacL
MCYTYLIKDTVAFRFVQATYVGLGIGHALVMVWGYLTTKTIPAIIAGNIMLLFPFVMSLLLFGRLKKQYMWVYRYPLALLLGVGLGLQIMGMLKASLIDQIVSTVSISLAPTLASLNSVLMLFFVIASMTYFFFTVSAHETSGVNPVLGALMKAGQYVLMGAIGAGFAGSFLGRLAVFMEIMEKVVYFIPKLLGLM